MVAPTVFVLPYFCCSAVFFGIFAYSAVLLTEYSPIFTAVECTPGPSSMNEPVTSLVALTVTGTTSQNCKNLNPYPITVEGRLEGIVYLKSPPNGTLKRVGKSTVKSVTYPSGGGASSEGFLDIRVPTPDMSVMDALDLLTTAAQTGTDLEIVSTVNVTTTAQPVFYGMKQGSSKDGNRVCGFSVRDIMNFSGTRKVGPAACMPTLEELEIPKPDDEPKTTYIDISEEAKRNGEKAKNLLVGLVMAFTGTGGIAMMVLGLRRCRTLSQARNVKGDAGGQGGDRPAPSEEI